MKKIAILALLICCSITLSAQYDEPTVPDYKSIEKTSITVPTSQLRSTDGTLHDGRLTMTIDEKRHLYFGYVFQPSYNPADTSQYNTRMATVLNKQYFSDQDYEEVLQYAEALLKEDLSICVLNAKLLVFAQKNNVEAYRRTAKQRNIVQQAIISTGDGMSNDHRAIKVSHE